MRVDQSAHQLVVAIRGKAIFVIKIARDGLGVKAIQPQDLFSRCGIAGYSVSPGQRGNPLTERSTRRESNIDAVAVVVRIVMIPTAQIRAWGRLPGHLAKRL